MSEFIRFRIKYPKLTLLLLTFVLAYVIFKGGMNPQVHNLIVSVGYLGTFIAGMGFTYGFTAAPATAILLLLSKSQNIIIAGLIAGAGSLIGDLLIFYLVRDTLDDEIKKFKDEAIIKYIISRVPTWARKFLVPILAGIIIASPLPDEIGVALLASASEVSGRTFSAISYVLNTSGIFVILFLGRAI
ncbi:MAG: hypothetical protein QXW00_02055 [Candidatus Woesearchaeota archaeon]